MNIQYENFTLQMVNKKYVEKDCLFVCVSGSHSFGWATKNSDLDLRFVYFPKIELMISPFYKRRTQSRIENNIDITEYPIDHYLQLLVKGNGNAVDNLFEPKIAEQKEHVKTLQEIVKDSLHKGFIAHCLGYSCAIKKDFDIPARLDRYGVEKLLLCRYRVLLQGLNLLEGNIEHNLPKLSNIFYTEHCNDVLAEYLASKKISEVLKEKAFTETNQLHEKLAVEMDKTELPSFDQSLIVVRIDRWLRQQYIGVNAPQSEGMR